MLDQDDIQWRSLKLQAGERLPSSAHEEALSWTIPNLTTREQTSSSSEIGKLFSDFDCQSANSNIATSGGCSQPYSDKHYQAPKPQRRYAPSYMNLLPPSKCCSRTSSGDKDMKKNLDLLAIVLQEAVTNLQQEPSNFINTPA
ncbi:hypothetical protein Tco_0199853 [Tanacetum coccineum]